MRRLNMLRAVVLAGSLLLVSLAGCPGTAPAPPAGTASGAVAVASPSPRSEAMLPAAVELARLVRHGDRDRRVIALTIDDGNSPAAVQADARILEALHVNATWFPIGRNVEAHPALWRAIAAAGFPVANHTQDHPILTGLSYARVLAEIEADNARVAAVIGEPLVPFLRPPGGAYDATVLAAAHAAGERLVVTWDASDGDTGRPYDDVPRLERDAEQGQDGSILLMHANLPYAQRALPAIIAWYRARGFAFVTLGQLFGIPGPVPFPAAGGASTTCPSRSRST